MSTTAGSNGHTKIESYAVEVDGIRKSDNLTFFEAVKTGLQYRQELPNSRIKVCDSHDRSETENVGDTSVAA